MNTEAAGPSPNTHQSFERQPFVEYLCGRCKSGMLFRQSHKQIPMIYCSKIGRMVPTDITECSGFEDVKTLSKWDMELIAKIIDVRDNGHPHAYL